MGILEPSSRVDGERGGCDHIITHIESDPSSESTTWHWDIAWAELLRSWDGVLLGVMFDSAYYWINAQSRRLARMSPRFMVVDICMPMDGSMLADALRWVR